MAYRAAPLPTSAQLTPYVPPAAVVTQFQAGHGFTTTNADASSNLNDTSNFVIGTQAATLVTEGTGLTTYLLHKGLPAVNMTNRQYVVVIECDSMTHVSSSGQIEFLAGSGASTSTTYQWQLMTTGTLDQNLLQPGTWIYYTLSFADATVNGSPAKTALTDYYIRLSDDNTGNKVTVRVNAIYAIPDGGGASLAGPLGYPSGVASVCLDDGFASQITNAKPVLDSYEYTPTTFVIWDQVGLPGRLTVTQYLEAQDISGWEVNSHSLLDADHTAGFDNISLAELETNVSAQQAIMAANGFMGKGSAYPKGQLTPAVRAMLRKYFAYVRGTFNKTLETWPPADVFNLRAVSNISPLSGGYSPTAISQSGGLIDQAVANRRWLILTFHKIIGNVTACNLVSGTTYQIVYSDASPPYNTGNSVTLQGFSPSGLNGTYTVTSDGTTGGFGYIEVSIPANPGSATVQGTALSATTDCDLASYTAIIAKLNSSGIPVRTIAAVLSSMAPSPLTAGDASMTVGGTPSAPTVETGTLDQIASLHPPAAAWSNNGYPITGVADLAVSGLTGATSASRYAGATTSGAPASGTFSVGDYTVDRTGGFWVCTTAGTVGSGCVFTQVSGSGGGLANPMTTLGDLIYENATPAPARLPGDTSNTRKFLRTQSSAGVAQAPAWDTLQASDLPTADPVNNWGPSDQGLIAWNYDIGALVSGSTSALASAGTVYAMAVKLAVAKSVTNILLAITVNGAALTSGQCFAALYQGAAGTLLGTTADQSSNWSTGSTTRIVTMAISGGPVSAAAGVLYVAVWFNGTTGPSLWRTNGTQTAMNAGLAAASSRWGIANTGVTTTAPGTLGTISAAGVAYWAGLS